MSSFRVDCRDHAITTDAPRDTKRAVIPLFEILPEKRRQQTGRFFEFTADLLAIEERQDRIAIASQRID